MKHVRDILSILSIALLAGCQQPSDVDGGPGRPGQRGRLSRSLFRTPAHTARGPIRRVILPQEQALQGGSFLLNRVTHDTGTGSMTFALAHAFFADSAVQMWGRNCGSAGAISGRSPSTVG